MTYSAKSAVWHILDADFAKPISLSAHLMTRDVQNGTTPNSLFWASDDGVGPILKSAMGMLAIIVVYVVLDRLLQSSTRLIEVACDQNVSLLFGIVQDFKKASIALAVVLAVPLVIWPRRVLAGWQSVDLGGYLRAFAVALSALIAWPLATMGYNHFFDQAYVLDRALLVLGVALIAWRPVFLAPFLIVVYPMLWQLNVPDLRSPIFAHKLMVVQPLSAIAGWWLLRCALPFVTIKHLVLVIAAMIAGRYWEAGLAKLLLNWPAHGEVHTALYAAYARGWLASWPVETVEHLGRIIAWFTPMTGWSVVGFELAAVVLLLHRYAALVILALAIVFHVAVFVLLGFLFWTWIIVDVALLILLFRLHHVGVPVFGPRALLLTIAPIALAGFWSHPPKLVWFDTPLSYAFHFEATGQNGTTYQLTASQFAPYSDSFTMAAFSGLFQDHAAMTGAYGITRSPKILDLIERIKAPEDVIALEKEAGEPRYSKEFSDRLATFISQYWENKSRTGERLTALGYVEPPRQFWSMPRADMDLLVYDGSTPVTQVVIRGVTTWFDGEHIQHVRTEEVLRVDVAQAEATR